MSFSKRRPQRQSISPPDYVICKALGYAIEVIEWLPSEVGDRDLMAGLLDIISAGDAEFFRLMARAHIEGRGIKVVSGQPELADRNVVDGNVINIR